MHCSALSNCTIIPVTVFEACKVGSILSEDHVSRMVYVLPPGQSFCGLMGIHCLQELQYPSGYNTQLTQRFLFSFLSLFLYLTSPMLALPLSLPICFSFVEIYSLLYFMHRVSRIVFSSWSPCSSQTWVTRGWPEKHYLEISPCSIPTGKKTAAWAPLFATLSISLQRSAQLAQQQQIGNNNDSNNTAEPLLTPNSFTTITTAKKTNVIHKGPLRTGPGAALTTR